MNPLSILYWSIVGICAIMTLTSSKLLSRLKSLRKNRSAEEQEKENQLSVLRKRFTALQDEIAKRKTDFEKAQAEINDLKELETKGNTELNQLKNTLESVIQERNRLDKENTAQAQAIQRQQKEHELLLDKISKLERSLRETERHIEKLKNANQSMAGKILELESGIPRMRKENETNKQIISKQQEELQQAVSESTELKDTLKETRDANQRMSAKTEELQSYLEKLKQENESRQDNISNRQRSLEILLAQHSELQEALKEKEQEFSKLENSSQAMTAKIEELQSNIQGLSNEKESLQEAGCRQQKELEEIISDASELRKSLREYKELTQGLENDNQNMSFRIEELQASIAKLSQDKQANQEIILRNHEELKTVGAKNSELKDSLKQKEQQIERMQKAIKDTCAKLKNAHAQVQGLEKEKQSQGIIIKGLKEDLQAKGTQRAAGESENESDSKVEDENSKKEREGRQRQLPQVLTDNKLVTQEALKTALQLKEKYTGNLLQFLFVNRQINDKKLAECLSVNFGVPYLPLGTYEIAEDIAGLIPTELVEKYWVVPVDRIENSFMLAMVDPFDNLAIKEIEQATGCTVKVYVSTLSEIAEKIQLIYKINVRGMDAQGNPMSPLVIKTPEYRGRERRRAVRFKTKLALSVVCENRVYESATEDICWDGLSFKLDHELPAYSKLTVQLSLPEREEGKADPLPVTAVAEVRSSRRLDSNLFMIGVKFLKIPPKDIYSIVKYASLNQVEQETKEDKPDTLQEENKDAQARPTDPFDKRYIMHSKD
ncbi:PilZ domain-containing protein [Candidatus Omnitrophota bacterium]